MAKVRPFSSHWRRAAPFVAVIIIWAVVQWVFIWAGVTPILKGDFPDSDGYARLLRVFHLVDTGSWYDGSLPRSNWPFGESMNWTRPLDIVLLVGAAMLRPFMNLHDSLFWFGVAISPLCALACAFAAGWMAKPILDPESRHMVMVLLLLQPGVMSYTDAGRPDHHGLLFLSFILACGFAMRALARPENSRAAIGAGVMIASGLWISTEFLAPLIACLATFGLLWLREGERWTRANRGVSLGFALGVAIALPIERSPVAGIFIEEQDRLSIVHLALALLLVAFWMLVPVAVRCFKATAASRGLAAAFGATIAGAAMFALYPRFFAGPLSAVDPVLFPIWFSRIAEWQPVLPTSLVGAGRFLIWLGPPALAAPWAVRILWLARHDDEAAMWFFVALTLALFVGLTMRGLRFSPYAEIASLIPLIFGIARIRHLIGERRALWTTIIRAFAVAAIILGLPFAGAFIMTAASAGDRNAPIDACRIAEIAPLLNDPNQLGGKRHVIVAALEVGPEIMYRTPHAVLATPMHRNAAGILLTYRLMTAADDAIAKAIIDSRSVDLILLCPDSGERGFFASGNSEDTFYNRLMDAKLPTWIHALPLPDSLAKHFRLFAVHPNSE